MTLAAQQHMIFGALCIDEAFRNEVFETVEERVSRLIRDYASANQVAVDEEVVRNVLNVVRGNCRVAARDAFAAAKAAACPCWPC